MEIRNSEKPSHTRLRRKRISSSFDFRISIFVLSLVLGGCAAPAEPVERKPHVPVAVTDLAIEQQSKDISLAFTVPKESTDHRALKLPPAIEVYRAFQPGAASGTPTLAAPPNPTLLATIPSEVVSRSSVRGRFAYVDSIQPDDWAHHTGEQVVYIVRTSASKKKESADSNLVSIPLYPPPEAIDHIVAKVQPDSVVLEWTPPAKTIAGTPEPPLAGFRIYRAEAAEGAGQPPAAGNPKLASPLARIGEADANSPIYRDMQIGFGKTYVYSVRSAVQYASEILESADSWVVVTPRDTFPPAVPQGLVVVVIPAQGGVPATLDLSWAISPETDIAGYNVYRSEQEAARGERLNSELLRSPSYRDMSVVPGRRYFFSVTAVDRSGNESPASAAVTAGISVESQTTP
ncbi:MAG: fibronectin type III domain-containing protein [Candidatus Acidiferrales bacterium]